MIIASSHDKRFYQRSKLLFYITSKKNWNLKLKKKKKLLQNNQNEIFSYKSKKSI